MTRAECRGVFHVKYAVRKKDVHPGGEDSPEKNFLSDFLRKRSHELAYLDIQRFFSIFVTCYGITNSTKHLQVGARGNSLLKFSKAFFPSQALPNSGTLQIVIASSERTILLFLK